MAFMDENPVLGVPRLRRCVQADAAPLALVGAATFLETFAGILAGEDVIRHCLLQHAVEKYQEWLADPESAVGIAELRNAPVGYAVLTTPRDLPVDLTPGDLELRRIYLLSRFHGCGTGRALLDWAKIEALARGAKRILLGVYDGNEKAIEWYRRQGFVQTGTRIFRVGRGTYHDLVLSLDLDQSDRERRDNL